MTRRRLILRLSVPAACALAIAIALVIVLGGSTASDSGRPGNESLAGWAGRLQGDPVSKAEFVQCALTQEAEAYQHYARLGLHDGPHFWSTRVGGTTPRDYLIAGAARVCKSDKAIEEAARDIGVADDISYPAFLKQWRNWNASRAKAHARGDVVYGPITYTEPEFRMRELNDLASAAARRLEANGISASRASAAFRARVIGIERKRFELNRPWLRTVRLPVLLGIQT